MDELNLFWDGEPKDEAPARCEHCGWTGTFLNTDRKHVSSSPDAWASLAGREGYEYYCPKCKWIITAWYWRIS